MLETSLMDTMRSCAFTNAEGQVVIVHDQPLYQTVSWVEFNADEDLFYIVFEDGMMQNLGFDIDQKMKSNMLSSTEVQLSLLQNKKFIQTDTVPIVINTYSS